MSAGQARNTLPLGEALRFGLQSVRLRLGRLAVVVAGIACATAFLALLLTQGEVIAELVRRHNLPGEGSAWARRTWFAVAVLITICGVTNAILLSVTERVREIGTLKCLGAMDRHIVLLFLFEALFLGVLGGLSGGLAGYLCAAAGAWIQHGSQALGVVAQAGFALRAVGQSAGLAVLLCLASAVYPVVIAARLEPAAAMRHEV